MRTEKFFKNSFPVRLLPFYLFGFLLILSSCEQKPNNIGGNLLPSADNFTVLFDSTEIVYGYTSKGDSAPSNYKDYHLLGSISDPYFGSSRAEIVTTLSPSNSSGGFGPNAVADSVILSLAWENWIGEGSLPQQLHVYELAEILKPDTVYWSNMDMTGKYKEPEIGTISFSETDTVLKIFITNQDFISRFLTAHDTILSRTDYFQEFIYGLYFTCDDAGDEGRIVQFDFDNPDILLSFYYDNDTATDQNQYYSLSNNSNGRVNIFRHDRSGYPIDEYLGKGSTNDSLIFMQSMAGVTPVISFPELTQWMDSMPVAISEAKLTFTMADTLLTMQKSKYFPQQLNLYIVLEDGNYFQTYDYILDNTSIGGQYDKESQTYSFTMKVQMQSILNGDVENLQMVLIPASMAETVSRGVLYGWNEDARKSIRLEITYIHL